MYIKNVKYLLPAQKIDMGGFPVKQAIPTQKVAQIDPFLLLHHGKVKYSNSRPARHQGIGPHPHRGFSPVTFVIEGEVHHRDSRGNNQIAKAGEVQWMHAGAGIIHSERPSQALADRKGRQEIIQLWINSPASSKMKIPQYTFLSNAQMPMISSEHDQIIEKLVVGNYAGMAGRILPESPQLIIWGTAFNKGQTSLTIPTNYNAALYLIKGKISLKQFGMVEAENLVVFENQGDTIQMEMDAGSQYLLLAGEPINEEISQSGPYVMNSQTEIMMAMRDYQMGKMGILIEDEMI